MDQATLVKVTQKVNHMPISISPLLKARDDVFRLVSNIPRGKVMSYGQVALAVGLTNPRHVGKILHGNSSPEHCPCHRVVHADGKLAGGYAFGGPGVQEALLRSEGVIFKNGKVDMSASKYAATTR